MYLKDLSLNNFRNIKSQKVDLNSKVNIFLGKNGQGKTNLLEAAYMLCNGSSFRTSKSEHLMNHNSDFFSVKSEIHVDKVTCYAQVAFNEGKKKISINEKKATPSQLVEKFPKVLFSPESLASIKEGPEERRALIDEALVLVHPKNAFLLSEFKKSLKVRNKILNQYFNKEIDFQQFNNLIHSINEIYFKNCLNLTLARIDALKELEEPTMQNLTKIMGSSHPLWFEYEASGENIIKKRTSEIHDAIRKRALELHDAEAHLGTSLVGPHKHDFRIIFDGQDSRFFCSQGQQRALILSFKIAQIVHHHEKHAKFPLLLLDDVLSELDKEKRFFLVRFLKEIDTQTLVTSTELSFFEELKDGPIFVFEVCNGQFELKQN